MRKQNNLSKIALSVFLIVLGSSAIGSIGRSDEMRVRVGVRGKTASKRTKPEFLSLRAGGGNYGGYGLLSIGTFRWDHFYFDIVRIFGGGGMRSERSDREYFGGIGIGIGVPWHLDSRGIHEIRLGTGIGSGIISQYSYCEESLDDDQLSQNNCYYRQQGFGLIFTPEIYYVWHADSSFAIQVGIDLSFATLANKVYEDPPGADKIEYIYPTPVLNGFFGIRL
jgi:hypothetical protein